MPIRHGACWRTGLSPPSQLHRQPWNEAVRPTVVMENNARAPMFTNETIVWAVGLIAGVILLIIIVTNIVAKFHTVTMGAPS
jgi:hypothetical protein